MVIHNFGLQKKSDIIFEKIKIFRSEIFKSSDGQKRNPREGITIEKKRNL